VQEGALKCAGASVEVSAPVRGASVRCQGSALLVHSQFGQAGPVSGGRALWKKRARVLGKSPRLALEKRSPGSAQLVQGETYADRRWVLGGLRYEWPSMTTRWA